jgi:hypothetical protein
MGRGFGKLNTSLASTLLRARCSARAGRFGDETNRLATVRQKTPTAASSNAHDKDGTLNKEFYR